MDSNHIIVSENQDPVRLDVFLQGFFGVSRSQMQKRIRSGQVLVNKKLPKKTGDMVKAGDEIDVYDNSSDIKKTVVPTIELISENKDFIVINKPANVLTHPTEADETGTLVDWLLKNYPEVKNVGESDRRPGIVHRLDKDASGLLVVARNQTMFEHLKKQFQDRLVNKEYLVLVHGIVINDHGIIDFAIDRGEGGRMAARPHIDQTKVANVGKLQEGKEALTEFWVDKHFSRFTSLKVKIYTGRTHQIRVHLLAYGHPVVGDPLYFNSKLNRKRDKELGRIFLNASKLSFLDLSGEEVNFQIELPKDLRDFLVKIK